MLENLRSANRCDRCGNATNTVEYKNYDIGYLSWRDDHWRFDVCKECEQELRSTWLLFRSRVDRLLSAPAFIPFEIPQKETFWHRLFCGKNKVT